MREGNIWERKPFGERETFGTRRPFERGRHLGMKRFN